MAAASCDDNEAATAVSVIVVAQPPQDDTLLAFSQHLRDLGATVRDAFYTPLDEGSRYPLPHVELACAIAEARADAREDGATSVEVALVGHSTSAYLSSIAALAGDALGTAPCETPDLPDAFVGIAGWYDIDNYVPTAISEEEWLAGKEMYFGGAVVPGGRPPTHFGRNADLQVSLFHGDQDTAVPLAESERFDALLRDAGYQTTLRVFAGGDHTSVLDPTREGDAIARAILAIVQQ